MIQFDFSNKNYIVTGGAGGMGREVVRGIVAGGGNVALVDINAEAAAKVCAEAPEQIHFYKMDLADHANIRAVAAQIITDMGQVHGLVNLGGSPYTVRPGDRIAQLMVTPVVQPTVVPVTELDETERGAGGFGSTGR